MPDSLARIFLLSHMRAYTSLTGHILGSHPQICGYYEMHIDYREPGALQRQLDAYRQHDELKAGARYLFDKLLHNGYGLAEQALASDVRILLALREPGDSIRSIVRLFGQKTPPGRYARPVEAANYYLERVRELARFSLAHPQGYFYFDAETLVEEPGRLLPAISDWLGLDQPLRQRYELFSQTGVERKGDSSARIHSGAIEAMASDHSDIGIPADSLDEALQVYHECRRQILGNACASLSRARF